MEIKARGGDTTAGALITLSDYVDYMMKVANFVAKIEGDINLNDPLSVYKNKTSVFAPKIV